MTAPKEAPETFEAEALTNALQKAWANLKGDKPWQSPWLVTCGAQGVEEALKAWDELQWRLVLERAERREKIEAIAEEMGRNCTTFPDGLVIHKIGCACDWAERLREIAG